VTQLDTYARSVRDWRQLAKVNHVAATALFGSGNPFLVFPAATLGHHAIEMYLKAALIQNGMTAFDPKKLPQLDPAVGLRREDCVWGHNLVRLAEELARRRPEFDLSAEMDCPRIAIEEMPMRVFAGFKLFDPFFSELRYPQELNKLKDVGEDDRFVLDELVKRLEPFSK
jgi:hypothetical protein